MRPTTERKGRAPHMPDDDLRQPERVNEALTNYLGMTLPRYEPPPPLPPPRPVITTRGLPDGND